MSWGRFVLVAIITSLVLLPVSGLVGPLVLTVSEPMRTIVIVAGLVIVYFVIDRLFVAVLHGLDRARRP